MPLEQIRKEIEAKASEELSHMRSSAHEESKRIVKEAEARAKEIEKIASLELEKELSNTRVGLEASAEMEAKKITLGALEEALDTEIRKVQSDLVKRLREEKNYKRIFAAAKARLEILGSAPVVEVGKKDAKTAQSLFRNAKVVQSNISGLVLYSEDRKVVIDMTLERLAGSAINGARGRILGALSGSHVEHKSTPARHAKSAKASARKAQKSRGRRRK